MNATLPEAKEYFLGARQVTSHCEELTETFATVISVNEVQ